MTEVVLPTPESNPGKAEWSEVFANDKAIREVVNGEIDTENLEAGAVTEAKLGDGAVTSRKFKPTSGVKAASEDLVLTGAWQDVPGASLTITPAVASNLLIVATFRFQSVGGAGLNGARGTIKVDAAAESEPWAVFLVGDAGGGTDFTISQTYVVALTAAEHTIKLRAIEDSGDCSIESVGTQFLYQLVAS